MSEERKQRTSLLLDNLQRAAYIARLAVLRTVPRERDLRRILTYVQFSLSVCESESELSIAGLIRG